MANKIHNNMHGSNHKQGKMLHGDKHGSMPGMAMHEKTANWPGCPGKMGPDRSAGVKKCKMHPKSEGV